MVQPSEVISLGVWGGPGGQCWSCIATNGITEINISEDDNIKSFSFTDANGMFSGTFGGRHPEDWGDERKISINWPSEYLMSISGTYGEYDGAQVILSLSFITNLTTYGPFGGIIGGEAFSIPIGNSVVAGFYGRSGLYLDAIGIYVQPYKENLGHPSLDAQLRAHPIGSDTVGPWGGSGGNYFTFKVAPSYIKQITVGYRENIKFISFKDADNREYGHFGGQDTNSCEQDVIEIENCERLTSISGTVGKYKGLTVITSLSFEINKDSIRGPFGTRNGTPFSVPIQREVIGFFGKAGLYLDSIGFYVYKANLGHPSFEARLRAQPRRSNSAGPWGGSGGDSFTFKVDPATYIKQITVAHRENIKFISFKDADGREYGPFGGLFPKHMETYEQDVIEIGNCERLTSISGTVGNYIGFTVITSLSFVINNNSIRGPYGTRNNGTPFSVPMQREVIGFFGKAGWYLDSIGLYMKL